MRAAIYSRKSTSEEEKHEDNKSVVRQTEHAKAFAKKRGWTVDPEHVYEDDGISGAEFKNRPGLLRMLNHLREFDVIVMSELSRLGRDQVLTSKTLADIEAAGIQVWLYLTSEQLKFDTAIDRFMVSAVSFAAELEREKAGQRSRDALKRRAEAGYNAGGACFGYDNVKVFDGDKKLHTDYKINPAQADTIRRIFTMYAAGFGHVTIARCMNGDPRYAADLRRFFDGACPPKPKVGNRGTGSWAPSSIRCMLYNERYVGRIAWASTARAGATARRRARSSPPRASCAPSAPTCASWMRSYGTRCRSGCRACGACTYATPAARPGADPAWASRAATCSRAWASAAAAGTTSRCSALAAAHRASASPCATTLAVGTTTAVARSAPTTTRRTWRRPISWCWTRCAPRS
jgi:DNA invertase Pin-like site-specific DNA recombinase